MSDSVNEVARLDFVGRLDSKHITQFGAARVPARLTKAGVFNYRNPDGSMRREFRSPEEVLKASSVATLSNAPVVIGHPEMVTAANWSKHAKGHVASTSVAEADKAVDSELVIQDGQAVLRVDAGDLTEVSCGYFCKLVAEPGVYEGQPYDYKQTDIRYNHVGLFPAGQGRQGRDVALRFDGGDLDGYDPTEPYTKPMTPEEKAALEALQKRCDSLEGERDALKNKLATLEAKAVERNDADEQARFDAIVEERLALVDAARTVVPKLDPKGLTNRAIMLAAIEATDKSFAEKAKDKSEDYIRSRFDSICAEAPKNLKAEQEAALAATHVARVDAKGDVDIVSKAAAEMLKRNQEAWKPENVPAGEIMRKGN